mmetsp:Transcript_23665/g.64394  ORF Transcript_23665/g.64394 Transcript_23665/m.64394 type:complete len:334 (-) Transcript_23665:643-1644(-)
MLDELVCLSQPERTTPRTSMKRSACLGCVLLRQRRNRCGLLQTRRSLWRGRRRQSGLCPAGGNPGGGVAHLLLGRLLRRLPARRPLPLHGRQALLGAAPDSAALSRRLPGGPGSGLGCPRLGCPRLGQRRLLGARLRLQARPAAPHCGLGLCQCAPDLACPARRRALRLRWGLPAHAPAARRRLLGAGGPSLAACSDQLGGARLEACSDQLGHAGLEVQAGRALRLRRGERGGGLLSRRSGGSAVAAAGARAALHVLPDLGPERGLWHCSWHCCGRLCALLGHLLLRLRPALRRGCCCLGRRCGLARSQAVDLGRAELRGVQGNRQLRPRLRL